LEEEFSSAAVEFHVAELVDHEEIDAAVAGDGAGEVFFVRGFDEFVHEPGRERVFDAVAFLGCRGSEADEQVRFTCPGIADEAQGLAFPDPFPVANVLIVAGLMFGFSSKSKSPSHLSRGNPAAFTRRTEERRSRSSHSASSSSARNPW